MGHVTGPYQSQGYSDTLTLDIAYLCAEFDDSSFSHSRDMTGASKI